MAIIDDKCPSIELNPMRNSTFSSFIQVRNWKRAHSMNCLFHSKANLAKVCSDSIAAVIWISNQIKNGKSKDGWMHHEKCDKIVNLFCFVCMMKMVGHNTIRTWVESSITCAKWIFVGVNNACIDWPGIDFIFQPHMLVLVFLASMNLTWSPNSISVWDITKITRLWVICRKLPLNLCMYSFSLSHLYSVELS